LKSAIAIGGELEQINLTCDHWNFWKLKKITCFKLHEYGRLDYGEKKGL
jgi:hypothetical protein